MSINTEDFLKNLVANNFTVDKDKIQKKLDDWKNVKVNLGVVGDSGSGKSTLINSLRDLFPTDKDAAPVGSEKETTQFPKPFKHPKNDNVIVWDIPGCNTPKFPINDYMRDIKQVRDEYLQEFDEHVKKYEILNVNPKSISYDLYIICCKDRFKETDLKIATEISKSSRNYYFVRTFIDQTIRNKESDVGKVLRNKPEEIDKIMITIRHDIRLQLSEKQLPHSERNLFIISSLMKKIEDDDGTLIEFEDNREKYEFPKLQQQIFEGLDEQKKSALIMTFSAFGVEGVKNKCKKFRNDIWFVSALSGASGLSPIPGTSLLIDMGILLDQVTRYIDALNLNKEKIRQYCMTFGVKYEDLKRDVLSKDPFFKSILSLGITVSATIREGIKAITKMASDAARKSLTELIIKFLSKRFAAQTAEELLKSLGLTVPIVGTIISSLIGAGISFTTTLLSLRSILSNFEENHIKIIEYCKAKNNSNSQN